MAEIMNDHPAICLAMNHNDDRHHDAVIRLYGAWDNWNTQLFDSVFDITETPVIIIAPELGEASGIEGSYVPAGRTALGVNWPEYQHPSIRLFEDPLTRDSEDWFRHVVFVMLHEMVHHFCDTLSLRPNDVTRSYDEAVNGDEERRRVFIQSIHRLDPELVGRHGDLFCFVCNQISSRIADRSGTRIARVRVRGVEHWKRDQLDDIIDEEPFCDGWPHNVIP